MASFGSEKIKDEAILVARILLAALFLVFGWGKLHDYQGTIAYMTQTGAPMPAIAAMVATAAELGLSIALILGVLTRPLAIVLAVYTLGTALIGHPYWTMTGLARFSNEINFFKNLSIMGGLFLLYVTGAGRYSLDRRLRLD